MKTRLLFGSDYDGTYRLAEAPMPENIASVRRFRAAGGVFGIVTGRNYSDTMRSVIPTLMGEYDFIVCGNGTKAFLADGSELFCRRIPGSFLSEIYEVSRGIFPSVMYFDSDRLPDSPADGEMPFPAIAMTYSGGAYSEMSVSSAGFCAYPTITQVTVAFEDHESALRAGEFYRERFDGSLSVHIAHTCVDLIADGADKAESLGIVADYFGIDRDHVYAAGDGLNDVVMLEKYRSFAMKNGDPAAIEAADRTVLSVGDAVASLI